MLANNTIYKWMLAFGLVSALCLVSIIDDIKHHKMPLFAVIGLLVGIYGAKSLSPILDIPVEERIIPEEK